MSPRHALVGTFLALLASVWGCDLGQSPTPDPQFLKIQLKHSFRDSVDTFNGTLTKDLAAGGTITVPFWLTAEEQDSILAEVVRRQFYDLPDTIPNTPGMRLSPDPGPQVLRIEVDGRSHQVVWYATSNNEEIFLLLTFIRDVVQATPEYQCLPPAQGWYL